MQTIRLTDHVGNSTLHMLVPGYNIAVLKLVIGNPVHKVRVMVNEAIENARID